MKVSREISPEIAEKIFLLEEKYAAMGQNLSAYMEGLLQADYPTYWDYIQLDVLLNLQHPKTPIPDEKIFIIYHQITELYFKLILLALERICQEKVLTTFHFITQLERINSYLDNLIHSFSIMIGGMDKEDFLRFRMALLPGSGFQSAQFRMIEIYSTRLIHLVNENQRPGLNENNPEALLNNIYWRSGATELATGKKTLTLKQFEIKYQDRFLELARSCQTSNLEVLFEQFNAEDQALLVPHLRELDRNINWRWPLMHYKSAVRYLQQPPEDIAATGGTNWQQFLPPKNKRIIFFPNLWTAAEKEQWGKSAH